MSSLNGNECKQRQQSLVSSLASKISGLRRDIFNILYKWTTHISTFHFVWVLPKERLSVFYFHRTERHRECRSSCTLTWTRVLLQENLRMKLQNSLRTTRGQSRFWSIPSSQLVRYTVFAYSWLELWNSCSLRPVLPSTWTSWKNYTTSCLESHSALNPSKSFLSQ